MKDWGGLETQLFTWDGWDSIDTGDFYFYNVELAAPVGDHKVGDKFPSAAFMMSRSVLEFYDEDAQVVSTHQLKVSVV